MNTTASANPFTATSPFNGRLSRAIPASERMIIKRDGSSRPFDLQKIIRAIALAYHEVANGVGANPHRDEALALYGLDSATYAIATDAARRVERSMELHYLDGRHPTIEQVQDIVEMALAGSGNWAQARAYILYRARRAEKRLRPYDYNGLADYIALSKYARYRPELGRREVFPEAVGRVRDMHLTFFKDKLALRAPEQLPAELVELAGPNAEILTETVLGQDLESLIYTAFHNVAEKRVLPSMRSLQFGGEAILKNHARIYNCSFSNVDRVEFFREFFFLLLAGCGVGFSVQRHHVALLPALPKRAALDHLPIWHYEVTDTIEGWADAIHALFQSYYDQKEIEFSFAKIRPKGAPLKTTGGKAPGHRGLKRALIKAAEILDGASSRQLRPFEVYEICMHVAGAVLSGGIRRSATICLFSPDDEEMMFAKTGDWWAKAKHREASNNSAVLNRSEDNRAVFKKLFLAQKEFGEPGFYFSDHREAGCNPCVPGDTWVLTDQGPRQVNDLIGQQFNAMVNGQAHATTEKGFFATCTKQLVKIVSEEGYSLRLTPNHKVLVQLSNNRGAQPKTEWVEAGNLKAGSRVVMHAHNDVSWSGFGTKQEGWLLGSLLGDGNLEGRDKKANLDYWGDDRAELVEIARSAISESFGAEHPRLGNDQPKYNRARVSSRPLFYLAERFGMVPKSKQLNTLIERTSSEFAEGFLRGWFDAAGSVQSDQTKGVSIRLSSVDHSNLVIAQRLLLRLGVYSVIYPNRNKHRSTNLLPDGRGGKKEYDVQPLHDLLVSGADMLRFSQRIGFNDPAKAEALQSKLAGYRRQLNATNFICTVASVDADVTEPVYDCTVPGPHAFDANGMYVHNCVEIGLNPVIDWELSEAETANLYRYGFYRGELPSLARLSGFQFCNLSTINAAAVKSTREFYRACINAAVIGTLQAAYTVTDYLGAVTRVINEHDALLGVSICGFMSNPELFFDQVMLKQGAHLCRVVNRIVAGMLSISPAARITCVKPEGTSSLLLGCASGIHPDHARRYFRRVRASRDESVFQALKAVNPQMTEVAASRGETDDIITFPVEAPENAILRKDISGVAFLELVKLVQQSWVRAGADPANRNPDVSHNVSNTTTVKAADWDAVEAYIWENRACFTGIALLQDFGDKGYVQAPREEVVTEADIAKWNLLVPKVVDYTAMRESEDTTAVALTPACAGGSCDVV